MEPIGREHGSGCVALKILRFEGQFEVDEKSKEFDSHGILKKRVSPLRFLRYPVTGLDRSAMSQELLALAGAENFFMVKMTYLELSNIAANKRSEYRGWVLTDDLYPMDPGAIQTFTGLPEDQAAYAIEILRQARLIEWEFCEFARKPKEIMKLGPGERRQDKDSRNSGNSRSLQEQNQEQKVTEIKPEQKEDNIPYPIDNLTADLRGLPAGGPDESGSGDLGSEDLDSERNLRSESGGSESGDLPRAAGRQSVNDTDESGCSTAHTVKTEGRDCHRDEPGAGGDLSWDMRIAGVNVEKDDPKFLIEGLSRNDRHAREQLIERAMTWLKLLLPAMDPPETARLEVLQEARGSQTTFENLLVDLWTTEKAEGILWMIRTSQEKLRDFHRARGRITNLLGLIVAAAKKKLGPTKPESSTAPIRGP